MINETRELNDAELEAVSGGGMSCATAIGVAGVFISVAKVLGAYGDPVGEANFAGKATGLVNGSCPS